MNQLDTFDPAFFSRLRSIEGEYFWFAIRRKWLLDVIKMHSAPPSKVLEIGCGTGNVSSFLARNGYRVTGCEVYKEAIDKAWPGYDKVQGDAATLPFRDNTFDVVGMFDVLEHFNDELPLLKEARRVLKKDGILVVTVPARRELWSYTDDAALHKRRYATGDLISIFKEASFRPLSADYIFMLLYLPMKLLRKKDGNVYDNFNINRRLNLLSMLYFECERFISRFIKLPFGTSIIAAAKK